LAVESTRDLCDEEAMAARAHLQLRVEQPNGKLDKFGGVIVKFPSAAAAAAAAANSGTSTSASTRASSSSSAFSSQEQLLCLDNLLLRGSRLRHSGFVYGAVVNTGEECKIRQDSRARASARVKRSSVERFMNRQIYAMAALQFLFCLAGGIASGVWAHQHRAHSYLFVEGNAALIGLQRFFTW
jgi:magnesium-transporting ATPase (P-type)